MADSENGGIDLSMLSGILSDSETMSRLSGILGGIKENVEADSESQPASAGGIADILENKELMAKLPEVISVIKPIVSGEGKKEGGDKKPTFDKRTALLVALKPYLSPRRCEAVDYMIRLSKLGDLLKTIT